MKGADGQWGEDAEDQAQEGLEYRSFCLPQEVGCVTLLMWTCSFKPGSS